MRRVLAAVPDEGGKVLRTNLLKPDQADARNRAGAVELGTESGWQLALNDLRVDPKIHQYPSLDPSFNDGHFHSVNHYAVNAASQSFHTGS
jgi:hypothetical protein